MNICQGAGIEQSSPKTGKCAQLHRAPQQLSNVRTQFIPLAESDSRSMMSTPSRPVDASCLADAQPPFRIRYASSGFLERFGIRRSEVLLKDLSSITCDDAADVVQAIVRALCAQTSTSFTCRSYSAAGNQVSSAAKGARADFLILAQCR